MSVDFGFESVSPEEKTRRVHGVFSQVAKTYDLMNDIMSGGLHRIWKAQMVLDLPVFAGTQILDVAGGTGDIAMRILNRYHFLHPKITVCDLTSAMLEVGRDRALDEGIPQSIDSIDWVCGNAESLPIADESVDIYTIAFGLRNVTYRDRALAEACRVLKPGGTLTCLEFSHVSSSCLKKAYDWYSFQVIPRMGEYIADDKASYQYLVESIRRFPNQETLSQEMKDIGFEQVNWVNLLNGVAAIHVARKVPCKKTA